MATEVEDGGGVPGPAGRGVRTSGVDGSDTEDIPTPSAIRGVPSPDPAGTRGRLALDLPSLPGPLEVLEALEGLPGRVLLETGNPGGGPAGPQGSGVSSSSSSWPALRALVTADPLLLLEGDHAGVRFRVPAGKPSLPGLPEGRLLPVIEGLSRLDTAIPGRWFGHLAHELGWAFDSLPPLPPPDPGALPDLRLAAHDWWIEWQVAGDGTPGAAVLVVAEMAHLAPELREARRRQVEDLLRSLATSGTGSGEADRVPGPPHPPHPVRTSLPGPRYRAGVEELRQCIRRGDIFQANLTHQIEGRWEGRHMDFHRALREATPAPWSAWFEVDGERSVSSVSPEGFLEVEGRRVRTSPIKGTAPRSPDPRHDGELAEALAGSEKDRAENLMITDLLRNDLSRVAEPGSVRAGRLAVLESHPSVHHLVSDVEAVLAPGRTLADLLAATFPGGSITGAPKLRAMELLLDLEPVRRGVYTGALGWMEADGTRARLSIAIRTAVLRGTVVSYGTGGGITLASDPAAEWQETLDKARAFLQVLGADPADLEAAP